MTQMGVNYLAHLENVRSNKAKEAEAYRSNTTDESERYRHNIATETLDARKLSETTRHNVAQEGIGTMQASASLQQADAAHRQASVSERRADIEQQRADTEQRKADTDRYKAETGYLTDSASVIQRDINQYVDRMFQIYPQTALSTYNAIVKAVSTEYPTVDEHTRLNLIWQALHTVEPNTYDVVLNRVNEFLTKTKLGGSGFHKNWNDISFHLGK